MAETQKAVQKPLGPQSIEELSSALTNLKIRMETFFSIVLDNQTATPNYTETVHNLYHVVESLANSPILKSPASSMLNQARKEKGNVEGKGELLEGAPSKNEEFESRVKYTDGRYYRKLLAAKLGKRLKFYRADFAVFKKQCIAAIEYDADTIIHVALPERVFEGNRLEGKAANSTESVQEEKKDSEQA